MPKSFLLRRHLKQEWNDREEAQTTAGNFVTSFEFILKNSTTKNPLVVELQRNCIGLWSWLIDCAYFSGPLHFGLWDGLPSKTNFSRSRQEVVEEKTEQRRFTLDENGNRVNFSYAGRSLGGDVVANQSLREFEVHGGNSSDVSLMKVEDCSKDQSGFGQQAKLSRRHQSGIEHHSRQLREAISKKASNSCPNVPIKQPYRCDQCGKIFKTKYTLTIHLKMPSHTGARPFVCGICGKGFRLSSTLCRHKIIHTSEKPHKCHICDKAFNRSSTLKTHIRTHSELKEFLCDICGKGFHQKGNLRNHVLIHTGEKPYRCNLCEKAFNKLSNLKFHMHVHTDNAPYRCRYCKTCFTRRCDLKLHISDCHRHNWTESQVGLY